LQGQARSQAETYPVCGQPIPNEKAQKVRAWMEARKRNLIEAANARASQQIIAEKVRIAAPTTKDKSGFASELDAAVESMKRVPWTALAELKGDHELLKKIDDAQQVACFASQDPVVLTAACLVGLARSTLPWGGRAKEGGEYPPLPSSVHPRPGTAIPYIFRISRPEYV
jgi:ParB family chromosome partitioning protein